MPISFGGESSEGPKHHWINWKKCCLPLKEGGLGIRWLEDACQAFAFKNWWNFRTTNYLWAVFMRSTQQASTR